YAIIPDRRVDGAAALSQWIAAMCTRTAIDALTFHDGRFARSGCVALHGKEGASKLPALRRGVAASGMLPDGSASTCSAGRPWRGRSQGSARPTVRVHVSGPER